MSNANPNVTPHPRAHVPSQMRYRRALTPGGTYFFTVNLEDRSSGLLTTHVDVLRSAVREVKQRHAFDILGWVVLPDHLHAMWALPLSDHDFSTRWMLIKSSFSRRVKAGEAVSDSRQRKGERGIWQLRFWEHQIRDDVDLERHLDYIHINPVKHGYVTRASEWPWSSIHRYIHSGVMPADWATDIDLRADGERIDTP